MTFHHRTFSRGLSGQVPGPGLRLMMQAANRAPLLPEDRERELVRRWKTDGDGKAHAELVRSHMRLVMSMAGPYGRYGFHVDDLVSEGYIGLLQALRRFEPDREVRVSTYAAWWISAFLKTYVLANWSLVKLGTNTEQKRLFFGLRKAKAHLNAYEEGDLGREAVSALAAHLKASEEEVRAMNQRLMGDYSLNAPMQSADGELGKEWQDILVDATPDPESILVESDESEKMGKALRKALTCLDGRERSIFEGRRLRDEPATLAELGAKHGVSPERVRQIEMRAFEKVSGALRGIVARAGLVDVARLPTSAPPRRPGRPSGTDKSRLAG